MTPAAQTLAQRMGGGSVRGSSITRKDRHGKKGNQSSVRRKGGVPSWPSKSSGVVLSREKGITDGLLMLPKR